MNAVDQRAKAIELEAAQGELAAAESSLGKDSQQLGPLIEKLASLYYHDGLYGKAELLYRRYLDILSVGKVGKPLLEALMRLGSLYRAENKLDDAESAYLKALAAANQLEDAAQTKAKLMCCLSGLNYLKQEYAQAQQRLLEASEVYKQAVHPEAYYCGLCSVALAAVSNRRGNAGEAHTYSESSRIVVCDIENLGKESRALLELIQAYYEQGRFAEVDELLAQSVFSDDELLWPKHSSVGMSLQRRGELFRAQGRFDDAERLWQRALEVLAASLGPVHPEVGNTAFAMGTMYVALNRYVEAEPTLRWALKARVVAFGVESPPVAACIETYAQLLKKTKRVAIALKLEGRAREIRTKLVTTAERAAAAAGMP